MYTCSGQTKEVMKPLPTGKTHTQEGQEDGGMGRHEGENQNALGGIRQEILSRKGMPASWIPIRLSRHSIRCMLPSRPPMRELSRQTLPEAGQSFVEVAFKCSKVRGGLYPAASIFALACRESCL